MIISYCCQSCDLVFDVRFTPEVPGRFWGPPEMCYPTELAVVVPTACPECGEAIEVAILEEEVASGGDIEDQPDGDRGE